MPSLSVSIHAPARGATRGQGRARPSGRVSIHAPARGATPPPIAHSDCNGIQAVRAKMVTFAGESEHFVAENSGKPHELNCLNEVLTYHGKSCTLEVRACHHIKRLAGRRDQRLAWRRQARPAGAIRPRHFLQNNSITSTDPGRPSWSTVIS